MDEKRDGEAKVPRSNPVTRRPVKRVDQGGEVIVDKVEPKQDGERETKPRPRVVRHG